MRYGPSGPSLPPSATPTSDCLLAGDGGNAEGPETHTVDGTPPAYCSNISLFTQPNYQPTSTGGPTLTFLPDGSFCPTTQPAYSAFRDPSFGHGEWLHADSAC